MGYQSKHKGEYIDEAVDLAHKAVLNDWQEFTAMERERICDQIGAQYKGNYVLEGDLPEVPVQSVNGMTGEVQITKSTLGLDKVDNTPDAEKPVSAKQAEAIAEAKKAGTDAQANLTSFAARKDNPHAVTAGQVGADPAGTAGALVTSHDNSEEAHPHLQGLIEDLSERLNSLLDSDDTTLDQLSELVAYITNNRDLISQITTDKVSVSDIVNNLTSTATNKPLSANQGLILKTAIDALQTSLKNYVMVTEQTLTEAQKIQARANIGAGTSNVKSYSDLEGTPPAVQYQAQELTEEQKSIARDNIAALGAENVVDVLRYTAQSLTEEQQAQARSNLGITISDDTPQADWDQNDPTQIDHVLNRTHYRVSKLAEGQTHLQVYGYIHSVSDADETYTSQVVYLHKNYAGDYAGINIPDDTGVEFEVEITPYGSTAGNGKVNKWTVNPSYLYGTPVIWGEWGRIAGDYLTLNLKCDSGDHGEGWSNDVTGWAVKVRSNDPTVCYEWHPLDYRYIPEDMRPQMPFVVTELNHNILKELQTAFDSGRECWYDSIYNYRLLSVYYDYDGMGGDKASFVGPDGIYNYLNVYSSETYTYTPTFKMVFPFVVPYDSGVGDDGKILTVHRSADGDFYADWEDPLVSTWRDLGEPVTATEVTWDGDTTDLSVATKADGTETGLYHVSDYVPQKVDSKGEDDASGIVFIYNGGRYGISPGSAWGDDGYYYYGLGYVAIAPYDNYTDSTNDIIYPKAGIYFKKDGDAYVTVMTSDKAFRTLTKIPEKYLPEGGAHILTADDSNYLYRNGSDTSDTTLRITRADLVSMTESGRQIIVRTVSENMTGNYFVTYVGYTEEYATAFLSNTTSCYTAEYSAS